MHMTIWCESLMFDCRRALFVNLGDFTLPFSNNKSNQCWDVGVLECSFVEMFGWATVWFRFFNLDAVFLWMFVENVSWWSCFVWWIIPVREFPFGCRHLFVDILGKVVVAADWCGCDGKVKICWRVLSCANQELLFFTASSLFCVFNV